ncbi:MAG: YfaZ family protein [Pseudomonadales bacterium]|nr:YfaZ family protein [Pseudomonadales bacterium]
MGFLQKPKALLFILGLGTGLTLSGTTNADTFSGDINDDAFKFQYTAANASSNLDLNASILYHDDNGEIYAVGGNVAGQSLHKANVHGSLGGKLYYLDLDGADGAAIGLGGQVNILIPKVHGLSFQVEAYYAPSVLSTGDIEHHIDFTGKAKYRVLDNGSVYLGYRKAHVDIENAGDGDVDEGFHVGMELDI